MVFSHSHLMSLNSPSTFSPARNQQEQQSEKRKSRKIAVQLLRYCVIVKSVIIITRYVVLNLIYIRIGMFGHKAGSHHMGKVSQNMMEN